MILSDFSIREAIKHGRIGIDPLADDAIQPSSLDIRLGRSFNVFTNHKLPFIDVADVQQDLYERVDVHPKEYFVLHPGEFVLAATLEWVTLAPDVVARIEGKSSLGRIGLLTHATAGFVDPGFTGRLTLELANVSTLPIGLRPGMKIGQLAFMQLTTPADRPYGSPELGSKYQGQEGPAPSAYRYERPSDLR